jgi:hypothetical protein
MYLSFYCRYVVKKMRVILHVCSKIQRTSARLNYVNSGTGHIQHYCRFAYSALNIQTHVPPILQHMGRQFDAPCSPHCLANAAHMRQFALCQLRYLSNPAYLQFCIFCLKYSNPRISVSIAHMPTVPCAFCPTLAAK